MEKLNKVEARQADRRRVNSRVLVWGIPLAVIGMGLVALYFALQASS